MQHYSRIYLKDSSLRPRFVMILFLHTSIITSAKHFSVTLTLGARFYLASFIIPWDFPPRGCREGWFLRSIVATCEIFRLRTFARVEILRIVCLCRSKFPIKILYPGKLHLKLAEERTCSIHLAGSLPPCEKLLLLQLFVIRNAVEYNLCARNKGAFLFRDCLYFLDMFIFKWDYVQLNGDKLILWYI